MHIILILQYQKPCEFLTDVFFVLDAFLKFGTHQLQKKNTAKSKRFKRLPKLLLVNIIKYFIKIYILKIDLASAQ